MIYGKDCMKIGGPPSKTKKFKYSIVNKYCERKLKQNPRGSEKKLKLNIKEHLKFKKNNKVPFV